MEDVQEGRPGPPESPCSRTTDLGAHTKMDSDLDTGIQVDLDIGAHIAC